MPEEGALEVPPPLVARRPVLAGAALGIATTALPPAALAASPSLVPAGDLIYPAGSDVLLYWTGVGLSFTPFAGTSSGATASGAHFRGGSNSATAAVSVGGGSSVHTGWNVRNSGYVLTVSGGDSVASPHLYWTLHNDSATTSIEVSSLVLYRAVNFAKAADAEAFDLRMAFYLSTSEDFALPVLRRTILLGHGLSRHIVVQLGLTGATALGPGATATVRAFPYSTSTERDFRVYEYDYASAFEQVGDPLTPLISAPDDVQTAVIGNRTGEGNTGDHTVAFIGRTLA